MILKNDKLGKLRVGEYKMFMVDRGVNECLIKPTLHEGDTFFTVRKTRQIYCDYRSQSEAELVAASVRIETALRRIEGMLGRKKR